MRHRIKRIVRQKRFVVAAAGAAALLLIALFFVLRGSSAPKSFQALIKDWNVFENPALGIRISYPKNWQAQESSDKSFLVGFLPSERGNLEITVYREKTSVKTTAEFAKGVRENNPHARVTEGNVNGIPVIFVRSAGETAAFEMYAWLGKGDILHFISETRSETAEALFRSLVVSLKSDELGSGGCFDPDTRYAPSETYVPAMVTFLDDRGLEKALFDECLDDKRIKEMTCSEEPEGSGIFAPKGIVETCPNGCKSGACMLLGSSSVIEGQTIQIKGSDE